MDPKNIWNSAAKNGMLEVIYDLHLSNFPGCTTDTMDYAAMGGHIDIFHFLFIYRTEGCSNKAFYWASSYGQTDMIKSMYLFFPEKCDILECIQNAKFNNEVDTTNYLKKLLLQTNYKKCFTCKKKITSVNSCCLKNTCKYCYYIKYPHMKPHSYCIDCNTIITDKITSPIKSKCKLCFNKKYAAYARIYRNKKKLNTF